MTTSTAPPVAALPGIDWVEIPGGDYKDLVESLEKGAGSQLDKFMEDANKKYEISMTQYIEKPCLSITEFISWDILTSVVSMDLFTDFRSFVKKYFKHPQLIALMEFPVIFLGASPKDIPAMYSLMNYGGYVMGTKYPIGGFYKLVEGMVKVVEDLGVQIHHNSEVTKIQSSESKVSSLRINDKDILTDIVVATADYHHVETLLPAFKRKNAKTFACSFR